MGLAVAGEGNRSSFACLGDPFEAFLFAVLLTTRFSSPDCGLLTKCCGKSPSLTASGIQLISICQLTRGAPCRSWVRQAYALRLFRMRTRGSSSAAPRSSHPQLGLSVFTVRGSFPRPRHRQESSWQEGRSSANCRRAASYSRVSPKAKARGQPCTQFQVFAGEAMNAAFQGYQRRGFSGGKEAVEDEASNSGGRKSTQKMTKRARQGLSLFPPPHFFVRV